MLQLLHNKLLRLFAVVSLPQLLDVVGKVDAAAFDFSVSFWWELLDSCPNSEDLEKEDEEGDSNSTHVPSRGRSRSVSASSSRTGSGSRASSTESSSLGPGHYSNTEAVVAKSLKRYANGDTYLGDWSKGKKHGQGLFTYANGDTYFGGWRGNQKHGQGFSTYANGSKYDGQFLDGKRHVSLNLLTLSSIHPCLSA